MIICLPLNRDYYLCDVKVKMLSLVSIIKYFRSLCLHYKMCFSSHVTFNVDSPAEIQQAAHIQVITKTLYAQDGQRVPASYGVLDRRMVKNIYMFIEYVLKI